MLGLELEFTAFSHHNIGDLLNKKVNYSADLDEHGKALAIQRRVLGAEHKCVAVSHKNIGSALFYKGE